ncbi:MAG: hypothetical protein J6U98_07235 [Abditibacteriota bacterium]|nr:hypothetical protein [Abditibacteriota bacterium]
MKHLLIAALLCASSSLFGSPFASEVIDYSPGPGQFVKNRLYNDPSRALGAPMGLYVDVPCNDSLVTLGDGGSITLAFDTPVKDDPANPYGMDFIVFSNAMFVGGDPYYRFQEPAFAEISPDGEHWYLILPNILPADMEGNVDTGNSETPLRGYAEFTPTVGLPQDLETPYFNATRTAEQLYTVPERPYDGEDDESLEFDKVSGGGDAFDIADAVVETLPGVPARDAGGNFIKANLKEFKYIRLTDAVTGDGSQLFGEISAEIDAVAKVSPAVSVGGAEGYGVITEAVVTFITEDGFIIESPDRSAAAKVITDSEEEVEVGDKLTITGNIGNRILTDAMFTVTSKGHDVKPVGMAKEKLTDALAAYMYVRTWGVFDGEFKILEGYYDKQKGGFIEK